MADIEKRNIILEFNSNIADIDRQVKMTEQSVGDLQASAKKAGRELSESFKTELAEKLFKIVKAGGIDLEKLGGTLEEIKAGIDDAFDTLTPEQFANAVANVNDLLEETQKETQKTQKEAKQAESAFVKLARTIKGGVTGALDTVAGAVGKLFSFVGKLGGFIALFGIADLIAGWSTFSKQVQATTSKFPGIEGTFKRINVAVRKIGELFGRTIAPIIERIGKQFATWLENLDFGAINKLFQAIGIVFSNFAKQVSSLFGTGEGSVTDALVGFATNVVAIINGVIQSFDEFLAATKAFFLDFANLALKGISAIAPLSTNIRALQIAVEVLADSAREDMGSISGAFKAGFDEIKNLAKQDIKFEDIIPTPTPEETKKAEDELKRQQAILQEWLETLNGVATDIMGFRTPAQELVDRIGELRKEIERLRAESQRLKDEGIISETQFKSAQLLIDQFRTQSIEQLRKSLEKFQLEQLTLLDSSEINALTKDLEEMGLAQQKFTKSTEVREIVERQLQRAAAERLRQNAEEQKRLEKLVTTLDLVSEGFELFGGSAIAALQVQRDSIQQQIANLDRLAQAQESRVQKAIVLAEKGNAELLQQEEQRLQLINDAREQAAQREREIAAVQVATAQAVALAQGISAVIQGFQVGGLITGIAQAVALVGTIATAIISIKNAFGNLPAFHEGSEFVEGQSGIDRILSLLTRGERVFTTGQNKGVGGRGVSNETVVARAQLGEQLEKVFRIKALGELTIPKMMEPDMVSDLAKGLVAMQHSQESRLDRLTMEVIGMKREMGKFAVNFNITPEGIEAAVSSVQERRRFRNNLRR